MGGGVGGGGSYLDSALTETYPHGQFLPGEYVGIGRAFERLLHLLKLVCRESRPEITKATAHHHTALSPSVLCTSGVSSQCDNIPQMGPIHNQSFCRGVTRIFGGGGGGGPRSAKEANKPNKRATELKSRTCTHQGSMFRPY